MMHSRFILALATSLVIHHACLAEEPLKNFGFEVPKDFEVTLYADDALASDIHSLTMDAKGRVVVASKGYVKILHDDKGIGKANRATLFADFPKSGAHGMYFDGNDLICNGDKGVRRLYDSTGAGRVDRVSEPWFPTKNDGEHAANGIVKGPDGWYYLITGNDAGIGSMHAGPGSPIRQPNSGTLVRFSPDGQRRQVMAHGFRNPYDLAFNPFGQLFTVDADGERVYHLPYYAPTRLFDIAQGTHHGWVTSGWIRSWSRPQAWADNVERMVEIGRGSPTGLVVYRHRAFPEHYRNGVFSLCWTFGRVYFLPLSRQGSTYSSKMEVFMRTAGDVGFAPTDLAVGPNGDLFIAIGGRGTRGSVFRVRYQGAAPEPAGGGDPLRSVLAADEPLSSWSRARWVPAARKLGEEAFVRALLDDRLTLLERIRAVEVLTELFAGVPLETAHKICAGKHDPELTARTIWSLSRSGDSLERRKIIVDATSLTDPRVGRAAWEALQTLPTPLDPATARPDWKTGLHSPDRRVRRAAILVGMDKGRDCFEKSRSELVSDSPAGALAALWIDGPPGDANSPYWTTCKDALARCDNPALRLEAVRLLQIALGEVDTAEGPEKAFVGYTARLAGKFDARFRQELAANLLKSWTSSGGAFDFEMARLLGMLAADVPGLPERIAGLWTKGRSAEDDIHFLLVLARIPGKRSTEVTRQTASALNGIHVKLAQRGAVPSDFVPTILEALLDRLVSLDPALPAALVNDASFGVPGHALFANKLPPADKQAAARKLLKAIAKLDAEQSRAAWNPDLVRLTASLPDDEALPILRAQFADPRLSDTIALLLAPKRRAEDRGRFLEALASTQPTVIAASAEALESLKGSKATPIEIGKVVRSLRRMESQKADAALQRALAGLLESWTGINAAGPKQAPADAWLAWFMKEHPQAAKALPGLASVGFAQWKKRLDAIDWEQGKIAQNVAQGEKVFQRKSCYRCHGEARRLGPDLTGAAQRFSRDDLFTAIFDPSKDIAPAFRPLSIVTKSGKVHSGMVIYESQQLYLLQTTPDTTVRVPGEEVESVGPSNVSFMPTGLLDDLTDTDLRDLYAYLKSLRKK